jgi:hypothetical protein
MVSFMVFFAVLVLLTPKFVQIFLCSDLKHVHITKIRILNLFKFEFWSNLKFVQIQNVFKYKFCSNIIFVLNKFFEHFQNLNFFRSEHF